MPNEASETLRRLDAEIAERREHAKRVAEEIERDAATRMAAKQQARDAEAERAYADPVAATFMRTLGVSKLWFTNAADFAKRRAPDVRRNLAMSRPSGERKQAVEPVAAKVNDFVEAACDAIRDAVEALGHLEDWPPDVATDAYEAVDRLLLAVEEAANTATQATDLADEGRLVGYCLPTVRRLKPATTCYYKPNPAGGRRR